MKKLITFLCFIQLTFTYGQLNIFGVDISKHISYGSDVYYKKFPCSGNPYYTIAEYKDMLGMKFILFDDYTAKSKTPQMKSPEKYLLDLKNVVSKSLGQNIPLYKDSSLTNPVQNRFMWVKKHKDRYLVGTLKYSDFSKRNDFRIIIYQTKDDLKKGLKYICSYEYSWGDDSYYDNKLIDNI